MGICLIHYCCFYFSQAEAVLGRTAVGLDLFALTAQTEWENRCFFAILARLCFATGLLHGLISFLIHCLIVFFLFSPSSAWWGNFASVPVEQRLAIVDLKLYFLAQLAVMKIDVHLVLFVLRAVKLNSGLKDFDHPLTQICGAEYWWLTRVQSPSFGSPRA